MKIGVITSGGGHELQINRLSWFFEKEDHFFVLCKNKKSIKDRKKNDYYAFYPDSRNILNFFRNIVFATHVLRREKPALLISDGAGVAVPFFLMGKFFFKTKLVFIEPYDFVMGPSMTGKLLYNIADLFLVQHKRQKKWFPKAQYIGSLL